MNNPGSKTRDRIHTHIEDGAGIHFNELVRESDFAPGQIQYHVRQLIDQGRVVRDEFYGQTHYYPPDYDEWERAVLALFRRETAREIVVYIIEHEPTTPNAVADDLGIARSTLEYHLKHLTKHEVVEKEYDDRNRVLLRLANPEETGRLLTLVKPTVPDRLIDQFTRLVDQLFENPDN